MTQLSEQLIDQCESPIERRFLTAVLPELDGGAKWTCQREILAGGDRFRVDFWCAAGGRRIVVECDGRDYHDFLRDRARDTAILLADRADEVFRFRGCDVNGRLEACVGLMRLFAPQVFRPVPAATLADRLMVSRALTSETGCKPILRVRCRRKEVADCAATLPQCQACSVIDSAPDCHIVQFKSPHWDWRSGKGGDAAWSMAEILNSMIGSAVPHA